MFTQVDKHKLVKLSIGYLKLTIIITIILSMDKFLSIKVGNFLFARPSFPQTKKQELDFNKLSAGKS